MCIQDATLRNCVNHLPDQWRASRKVLLNPRFQFRFGFPLKQFAQNKKVKQQKG